MDDRLKKFVGRYLTSLRCALPPVDLAADAIKLVFEARSDSSRRAAASAAATSVPAPPVPPASAAAGTLTATVRPMQRVQEVADKTDQPDQPDDDDLVVVYEHGE